MSPDLPFKVFLALLVSLAAIAVGMGLVHFLP